jgi:hypothetical protein
MCTCGKVSYYTRRGAKRAARETDPHGHTSAYRCGDGWHWGHLPLPVIRGTMSRSDL